MIHIEINYSNGIKETATFTNDKESLKFLESLEKRLNDRAYTTIGQIPPKRHTGFKVESFDWFGRKKQLTKKQKDYNNNLNEALKNRLSVEVKITHI
ncbi:MAG: hypothetical protein KDD03_13160 [Gelidibacter sp.]|nr:hypothetical protein [Gelidibacter sp.]